MNIYEKITKVILENCLDYKRKIDPFNRDFFPIQKHLSSDGKWSSQPKYHSEP